MDVAFKIPQESSDYRECSEFVAKHIGSIMRDAIEGGRSRIKEGRMSADQLICGDAAEVVSKLPNASVDLVIADPPYNPGKDYGNNRDLKAWNECA